MNFDEYQKLAKKTVVYPKIGESFVYPAMGLAGEAGEVIGKIRKIFRDKGGKADDVLKQGLMKELGDVLWYLSQLATELDLSLNEVAEKNIEKLASRMERGVLKGDGDDR